MGANSCVPQPRPPARICESRVRPADYALYRNVSLHQPPSDKPASLFSGSNRDPVPPGDAPPFASSDAGCSPPGTFVRLEIQEEPFGP